MSAPSKATGGRRKSTAEASGRKTRGSGRSETTSVKLCPDTGYNLDLDDREDGQKDRAAAIRAKTPKRGRGGSAEPPRHDTARSARPRILAAARKMAARRGYSRLRLVDITTEAKITHQGFYGHFANKRHAVAVATSDDLGAIADLANRGSKRDEAWAARLLADIDRALIEAYPATDGPERWLRDRFLTAFAAEGGYGALRINELIKVSRLGHGEFYRRYGGKLGCLRRIYSEILAELGAELLEGERTGSTAERVGAAFSSDPDRGRFLILGASHLPDGDGQEDEPATQSSLQALLTEVTAATTPAASPEVHDAISGGLLEVIRSAVLADRIERIEEELRMLARAWGPGDATEARGPLARAA